MLVKRIGELKFICILEDVTTIHMKVKIYNFEHPRGLTVVTVREMLSSTNARDKIGSSEKENEYQSEHRL